jgi:lipopolysaccharide biosynthesis regulator YciM
MTVSLHTLLSLGRRLGRWLGARPAASRGDDDPEALDATRRAREARQGGHVDEARTLYRYVLQRWPCHVEALRALRDFAIEAREWDDAVALQQRLLDTAGPADRAVESEWLAVGYYELGRLELARAAPAAAIAHFKAALRADRAFLPAVLALGDAYEAAGDHREAVRTWERAAETRPVLPLLARLERVYHDESRPDRMITLYRAACERAPDDLGLAAALGRVYFELEMLDEAAEQFEKLEVRAPELPVVHAFLGAVFERRGQTRDAFDGPHRCEACHATAPTWQDRCGQCHRWNTLRPVPHSR